MKKYLSALLALLLLASPAFADIAGKDATSATKYWKAFGAGTTGASAYVPYHLLSTDGTNLASFGSLTPTSTPAGWLNSLPFAQYHLTPLTLTDGQTAPLQVNASGYLLTAPTGTQPVSGTFWQATQPISGTVGISGTVPVSGTFFQATQPVSLAAIPINAAASTAANQATTNTSLGSIDTKLSSQATAALQGTGNTSLGNIDTKTPALGQALAAGSVPVVLTAAQLSTLTPLSSVSITGTPAVSISGTPAVTVSGVAQDATLTGGTAQAQLKSGTKGTSTAALVTSTAAGSNHQALDTILVDTSGSPVVFGSGGTASAYSSAFPSTGTAIGATDGTNMKPLNVTAGGLLKMDGSGVTQPVSGTFWQATQPVSGTFWQATQPVSGSITANIGTSGSLQLDATGAALNVAQAAAIASKTGPMIQGSVTTAAPTYTTATVNPISLDTSGNVRVSLKDSPANTNKFLVTPDSVALPANQSVNVSQINAVTPLMGNGLTGTGSQRVTIASDNTAFSVNAVQSGTWTVQPGNTANTTAWKVDNSAVTQPASVASGQIVDAGIATLGAKADAANTATNTTAVSAMSVLKEISAMEQAPASRAVTGTFWQATQPVSLSTLPALTTGSAVIGALTANQSVNTAQINGVTPLMGNGVTGTGSQRVTIASDNTAFAVNAASAGDVASGATDSGNPVKTGGLAKTSLPTAVTDGQRVGQMHDKFGRQVVIPGTIRDLVGVQQTTVTASTAETTIVTAGAAGVFEDITNLTITNSSATATLVTIKDATAGTTRAIYSIAANGGIVIPFPVPLAQSGAAANWTETCGTSLSSLYFVVTYEQNK